MLLDAAKNGIIANLKAILMYIIISRAHAIQLGVAMGYLCRRLKLSKFGKKFSPASYWPLWTTVPANSSAASRPNFHAWASRSF
jgi:hypothetical protein